MPSDRRQVAFRLGAKEIEIITRFQRGLERSAGHPVSRAQALRAMLEGFLRGEQRVRDPKLPFLSDTELLDRPRVK